MKWLSLTVTLLLLQTALPEQIMFRSLNHILANDGGIYVAEAIGLEGRIANKYSTYWGGIAHLRVTETISGKKRDSFAIPFRYPVTPEIQKTSGYNKEELYGFEGVPMELPGSKVVIVAGPGESPFTSISQNDQQQLGFNLLIQLKSENDPIYKKIITAGRLLNEVTEKNETLALIQSLIDGSDDDILPFGTYPGEGVGHFTQYAMETAITRLAWDEFESLYNQLSQNFSRKQLQKLLNACAGFAITQWQIPPSYRGETEISGIVDPDPSLLLHWLKTTAEIWKPQIPLENTSSGKGALVSSHSPTLTSPRPTGTSTTNNNSQRVQYTILLFGIIISIIAFKILRTKNKLPHKNPKPD